MKSIQESTRFDRSKQLAAILVILSFMLFTLLIPLLSQKLQHYPKYIICVTELIFVVVLVGCCRSPRIVNWTFRAFAGVVVALYAWYLIDELFSANKSFDLPSTRREKTPWNALLGLLVFGLPCLCYLIFGGGWLEHAKRYQWLMWLIVIELP
jgi:hypothetical protein